MPDIERRPRLLDLFCGAGGAAMGYHRAGFDVVGVDINPQPNYPFEFHQADALDWMRWLLDGPEGFIAAVNEHGERWIELREFDAIHASPPCQAYTKARKLQGNEHPDLIAPVRDMLRRSGLPYVIENVPGAPLVDPVMLCGTMFALPLYRHRLFECSVAVTAPLHGGHWLRQVKMGRAPDKDELIQVVGNFSGAEQGRQAMGTPWMTKAEMREAIPPAYTEHIGGYLMAEIKARAVA